MTVDNAALLEELAKKMIAEEQKKYLTHEELDQVGGGCPFIMNSY